MQIPTHVEVALHPNCTVGYDVIRAEVRRVLTGGGRARLQDGPVDLSHSDLLQRSVLSCNIVDLNDSPHAPDGSAAFWQCDPHIHVFQLSSGGAEQEIIDGGSEGEEVSACNQWVLPTESFDGLWESLVLDPSIKNRLLEYSSSALLFSDKGVSKNVVTWNRIVLLHGEPGTGKTSLCKALAQKLSIRLRGRFESAQLLEINSHSLFSKWFSESGKLVDKLFSRILELAEDEDCLICILIDEVESLTAARSAAFSGSEPSDAIRVVNSVLTQIDTLRAKDNVLVLATSNISKAIDVAFVDRADIKLHIGPPPLRARYEILRGCLLELMRTGIIVPEQPIPAFTQCGIGKRGLQLESSLSMQDQKTASAPCANCGYAPKCGTALITTDEPKEMNGNGSVTTTSLAQIALRSEGLSGRALRKLPFQAHAFYVQKSVCTLYHYLSALDKMVIMELQCRDDLSLEHL